MATTIDGPWCLAQPTYPNGPYFLSTAGETYILGVNVVTQGTTFVVANTGITLDLAGYSITYCDRPQVTIANGDFETTDFTGWDFTHAPSFSRVAASPFAHGSYMLQGTITTPEYFTTPAFTPTVYPYEYNAWFQEKSSNSGDTVKIEIIKASDGALVKSKVMGSSMPSRGICGSCVHGITNGDALKIRITCTPSGASTFWIDWIQYLFNRDYGIYCTRIDYATSYVDPYEYYTYGCPPQLYNVAGFHGRTLPTNFYLTDSTHTHTPLVPGTGLITSGAGAPREGFVLNASVNSGTLNCYVDGVNLKATGIDAGAIHASWTSRLEVTNSKLENDIPAVSNRYYVTHNIRKEGGSILVEDSTILNSPNYGIHLADLPGTVKSTVQRNTITQRGIVTERYAIALGQSSNVDILNNTINVTTGGSGRGILIDSAASGNLGKMKDIHISYNDITVVEKRNVEYSILGLEVPGIRIRDYGNKGIWNNIEIDHNTINVETGQTDDHVHAAYGIRVWMMNPNGYSNNSKLFIHDNDVTALCSRARGSSAYHAAAIVFDSTDANTWPLIYNNDLESNCYSVLLGGYSDGWNLQTQDLWLESNTHIKSATYPGLFTFQSIALGSQDTGTNRPIGGIFILDPKFSGGAPTSWTWNDSDWSTGMTGEVLSGWIFTINGDVDAADITVTDALPLVRFTGMAEADGDLGYVPAPILRHVHTKGQGSGVDTDTTLTPLSVQYESSVQLVTPTANQILSFSTLPPVRLVFVRKS